MSEKINLTELAELIDQKQPHCICEAKLYGNALRHCDGQRSVLQQLKHQSIERRNEI